MDIFSLLATVALLIWSISCLKMHPFIGLLLAGFILAITNDISATKSLTLLVEGFSKTFQWIALIMIFGTFIGQAAQQSGGATNIAHGVLRLFGVKRLPSAMGASGYLLSIPVFVDVAYIMMKSVTEMLSQQSGKGILVVGLSLVAGLTASHALMPPTPGPIAIVGILGADLGSVIMINAIVALTSVCGGVLWASKVCNRYSNEIELPTNVDKEKQVAIPDNGASLWLALIPILIPLILISISSFLPKGSTTTIAKTFTFLGTPAVALFIGALLSLLQFGSNLSMSKVNELVEASIEKSAMVIMITGAGGAFGYAIRGTGIVESISDIAKSIEFVGFLLPFFIAALFTTATGSITVSMITSASLISPLLSILNISPELAVAMIGCGAFCVFHVNSSFFWLLNRMHNIPPAVLLKTYTPQSLVMGLCGLCAVLVMKACGLD